MFGENQFHSLRVKRSHGGQLQVLDHVQRALLILLEVLGLQVLLIGSIRGVDLENADLGRVLGTLHREQADDARFTLH